MIDDSEGEQLVKLARESVGTYLNGSSQVSASTSFATPKKAGVFVTLNKWSERGERILRGCIGFPVSEKDLCQSVIEAAIAAATNDPRFPPLIKSELSKIIFELSVLSPPELIQVEHPREYHNHIKIGRDGLMLKWERGSGLLLPQVAKDLHWDIDEYLLNLCYKAGASPDTWVLPGSKIYRFQAQVYMETKPRGKIIRLQ